MQSNTKKIEEGLKEITNSVIQYVLEFLKTGVYRNKNTAAYMTAYSAVHSLADDDGDNSRRFLEYYNATISSYMKDALIKLKDLNREALIDAFLRENNQCKILIHWMRRVFTYLDKFYLKQLDKTLCSIAMKLFYDTLFTPLKDKLFAAVVFMIEEDRDCKSVDRFKINNILRIFEEVDMKKPDLNRGEADSNFFWTGEAVFGVMNEWVDKYFIVNTEAYISKKASEEIASSNASEYIRSALKFLTEEDMRKSEYLHKLYHDRVDKVNFKYIIENNCRLLGTMTTGIKFMFNNKKETELKEAYKLISRHPESLKSITEQMDPYIREKGDELYNNKELTKDPIKFIPELMKLKKDVDALVEFAFDNHILFQDTKNKAFAHFMNKELYSKQLSNYCDFEMKNGMRGANDTQIEEKLNNIINLFKCLNNKLVFQLEYVKKLSDRLVQGKSISIQAEKNLISKLKAEAGVTYVNKMTSMLQDLETSKSVMDQYKNQTHRGSPNGISFNVQVLQSGAWEIDKIKFETILILPPFISNCMDDFNNFYISSHKTHKLSWVMGLGNMDIQYLYLKKQYQSVSTLAQLCILLALEKYEKLSLIKLSEVLGYNQNLVVNEANALLYHLSFNPKRSKNCGIISADSQDGQDLKPENEITINKEFMANSLRINTIPTIFKKPVGQEEEQEKADAAQLKTYRNILIDSCLTRIMKGRIGQKTSHVFLVGEVAKQIELFQAQPPAIKDRIEALVEKGIIKRNDNDRNSYDYVA